MKPVNEKQRAIGKRLAEMRKQQGWSQSEMAQRLNELLGQPNTGGKGMLLVGVNGKQTVSQLERGTRGVTVEMATAYADIFGVSLDYTLCRSERTQPEHMPIGDMLGLSDKAIAVLKDCKEGADIFNAYEQDPDPIKLYKLYGGESSQKLMRGKLAVACMKTLNTLIEYDLLHNMFLAHAQTGPTHLQDGARE